jgi:hypothetical protein
MDGCFLDTGKKRRLSMVLQETLRCICALIRTLWNGKKIESDAFIDHVSTLSEEKHRTDDESI